MSIWYRLEECLLLSLRRSKQSDVVVVVVELGLLLGRLDVLCAGAVVEIGLLLGRLDGLCPGVVVGRLEDCV